MLFVNEDKRASSCYSERLHSKADTCINVVTYFETVHGDELLCPLDCCLTFSRCFWYSEGAPEHDSSDRSGI